MHRGGAAAGFCAAERCYLIPGDSPLGYRLPLDSLPWVRPTDQPQIYPADPTQEFAPLPPRAPVREQVRTAARAIRLRRSAQPQRSMQRQRSVRPVPERSRRRVADRRERQVRHCPRRSCRDRANLDVRRGARTACSTCSCRRRARSRTTSRSSRRWRRAPAALGQPVIIEGYEPPADPRLVNFKVTPDPGVIEVNVQPSASWDELVERTRTYTTRRTTASCAPRNSCSTAVTWAPAAATTSCSAVPAARFAVPAPARSVAEPPLLLAQSSLAVVLVLGPVLGSDVAGAARRRGAQRLALRARDRVQAIPRGRRRRTALAHRSVAP